MKRPMLPKHPVSERKAMWFHAGFALIGLAHIAGGLLMMWFHGTGAHRHWLDRDND